MGKQKTALEKTNFFPPDIWALITHRLDGEDIRRLKMMGSKILWRKLTTIRAVESIRLGTGDFELKRWPVFLNELPSLSSVRILNTNEYWWRFFELKLDMLPPTLRKLSIRGDEFKPETIFRKSDGSCFLPLEHVPHLECLELSARLGEKHTWLAHMPPCFTSLEIHAWDGSVTLPASLIHLKAESMYIDEGIQGNLPSQLESITTDDCSGFERFLVPLLPPSFISLTISTKFDYILIDPAVHRFPSTITRLRGLSLAGTKQPPLSTKDFLSHLPSKITDLKIASLASKFWSCLPQTLELLVIERISLEDASISISYEDSKQQKYIINTIPVQTLPKSIKNLSLLGKDIFIDFEATSSSVPQECSLSQLFPPNLTSLTLFGVQLSIEAAKQLPTSIQRLRMGLLHHSIAKYLPRGLTELSAEVDSLSPDLIKFLPRTLNGLFLSPEFNPVSDPRVQHYFDEIQIVHGSGTASELLWTNECCLPPKLNALVLFSDISNESFLGQNFGNLTQLDARVSPNFTYSSFSLFSPWLRRLSLSNAENMSGSCFGNLPRNLISLSLDSGEIYDHHILGLPRTLNSLVLSKAGYLTDSCILNLPKGLKYVVLISNSLITPDVFMILPPRLRSIATKKSFSTATWYISSGKLVKIEARECETSPKNNPRC